MPDRERLVVVGNGMAGMACVEQILKYDAPFDITVFGDETHTNYNRVMLSSVLAGEKAPDDIVINSPEWYRRHGITLHVGVRIEQLREGAPRERLVVRDQQTHGHAGAACTAEASLAMRPEARATPSASTSGSTMSTATPEPSGPAPTSSLAASPYR